ncbi:acyl-CoA dehydrogenase family protein [Dactylosporangium sp. NPDC050688]|uniref:acyl-CoA dehydrogenase family protein n=1 Tax=Dactylosporangium sp. NPDC050688 TaxID=3157217 RepID=UPI0033DB8C0C
MSGTCSPAPAAAAPALTELLAQVDEAGAHRDGFPAGFVRQIAATGLPGGMIAARHGGAGLGHAAFGEVNRTVAEVSPALQSLFTVHGMVSRAVTRWGDAALRQELLPMLAAGRCVAAFALTEPGAGSDIRRISTSARPTPGGWVLDGRKTWVTFGQVADVFLVFAVADGRDLALVVRRDDPGVEVRAAAPASGFRASRLAELRLTQCAVDRGRLLGRPGTALTHIATDALTLGRLCVAYGAWGLARTALSAALRRSVTRHQFDGPLHGLQLVRGLLADAGLAVEAAGLLCRRAGDALDRGDEWAVGHVLAAKLAASRAASTAAAAAAQLHGADGLVEGGAVDRHLHDARVMELIEGNTQLLQHMVAEQLLARFRDRAAVPPPEGGADAR